MQPAETRAVVQCDHCGQYYRLTRLPPPPGALQSCRCGAKLWVGSDGSTRTEPPPPPALSDEVIDPRVGALPIDSLDDDQEEPEEAGRAAASGLLFRLWRTPWIRYPVAAGIAVVLLGGAVALGALAHYSKDLPSLHSLENYKPKLVTEVYSGDGAFIGAFFEEQRYLVTLDELPDHVPEAFIAAEDGAFRTHGGVDLKALMRAVVVNVARGRKAQGASTITQQVARTFLLTKEKRISRKIREILLARRIEDRLSKDDILFLYMNQIYLGHGAHGVEAAARLFFGKHASELNVAEAAMIAGLPQAPSRYSPNVNFAAAKNRQEYVIGRMEAEGFISPDEAAAARAEQLAFVRKQDVNEVQTPHFTEHVRRLLLERYGHEVVYSGGLQVTSTVDLRLQRAAEKAVLFGAHRVEDKMGWGFEAENVPAAALRAALDSIDRDRYNALRPYHPANEPLKTGSVPAESLPPLGKDEITEAVVDQVERSWARLKVGALTGIVLIEDHRWAYRPDERRYWKYRRQDDLRDVLDPGDRVPVRVLEAEESFEKTLGEEDAGPYARLRLWQATEIEAAVLSMRVPDGAVVAMVGGKDFANSEFNRATQAKLQAGSTFKPLVYTAALDHPDRPYNPSSVILDAPIVGSYVSGGRRKIWKPKNAGDEFLGPTTLRRGLIMSRNLVSIRIIDDIGVNYTADYLARFGFDSELNRDRTMVLGSSSVTMEEVVRAFSVFPSGGIRIEPWYIAEVRDKDGNIIETASTRPADERVIDEDLAYVMLDLLQEVVQSGTAVKASVLGAGIGGKTGTTNDFVDAWFTGVTPRLVTSAWVGRDNHKTIGTGMAGGEAALPIWIDYMREALEVYPERKFERPRGVVIKYVDKETGLLAPEGSANRVRVAFRSGTEPTEFAPEAGTVTAVQDLFAIDGGL